MVQCINGWTKEKVLNVLNARSFEEASYVTKPYGGGCVYLREDGNRCGVGMFIPVDHVSTQGDCYVGSAESLIDDFPELSEAMPFHISDLLAFQFVHDQSKNRLNAKQAMIEWVEEHVKG
jgi:hypothetical protein